MVPCSYAPLPKKNLAATALYYNLMIYRDFIKPFLIVSLIKPRTGLPKDFAKLVNLTVGKFYD